MNYWKATAAQLKELGGEFGNNLNARAQAGLSVAVNGFKFRDTPILERKIFGDRRDGLRWYRAGIHSSMIPNWQEIDGDPNSGLLPKNYATEVTLSVDKDIIDLYLNLNGGHQAVAYALGSSVMVGICPERTLIFATDPQDAERYAKGMGVGRKALKAALGVRTPDGALLVPADLADRKMTQRPYDAADIYTGVGLV